MKDAPITAWTAFPFWKFIELASRSALIRRSIRRHTSGTPGPEEDGREVASGGRRPGRNIYFRYGKIVRDQRIARPQQANRRLLEFTRSEAVV